MKKIMIMLIMFILIFTLSGCFNNNGDYMQKIVSPKLNKIPIQGKWIVKSVLNKSGSIKISSGWLNKIAEFSGKYAVVGDNVLYDPNFRIRKLNTEEYLLFNHKSFGRNFNISSKETDIVTITGRDKYLCEILIIDNKNIVLSIDNYNLLLNKVSDKFDENLVRKIANNDDNLNTQSKNDKIIRTGILLGLRFPAVDQNNKKQQNLAKYNYRTLWISAVNKKLHPILETENIFFPRRSGFWKIGVNRTYNHGHFNDVLYSYNISINENNKNNHSNKDLININYSRDGASNIINYVGNDYVSIENDNLLNGENLSRLKISPIDSLPILKSIGISDIENKEESSAVALNLRNLTNELKNSGYSILDEKSIGKDIGLIRKTGHWYFEGRVDYMTNNKIFYKDYRINLIPPSNMVFYDDLCITWNEIKDKVPDAVDVFTSPNKDLAIILSKNNKMFIYELNNNIIGNMPLKTYNLKKGEKIVMAEWATGSYVENWEKSFESLNSVNLK